MEEGIIPLIVVATSIWVLVDASKQMAGLTKQERQIVSKHGGSSPFGWFLGSLLLWIIIFPWYLVVRSGYAEVLDHKRRLRTTSKIRAKAGWDLELQNRMQRPRTVESERMQHLDLPDLCGNCGRAIGKLETPAVWNDEVVCQSCRTILEKQFVK